jgi:predicted AlkP superfamily pyrophosphatase or phosphodiesterase
MARTTVLISVDGMRPDGMQQAHTPTIDRLAAAGATTMRARSVMPSVTLPCHTSMFRGVDVARHGITTNLFMPLARPVPSLFDVAHAAELRVGSFYNWGQLRDLSDPSSLDVDYMIQESHFPDGDGHVADAVVEHVARRPFDFLFVYLGFTDTTGHDHGWMTEPYIDAISTADACIGRILEALNADGEEPVVLVTSDHGGHERCHGTDTEEDMTIPWVLAGPGIPHCELNGDVSIVDVAPTLAALMGLPAPREWDGKAVLGGAE